MPRIRSTKPEHWDEEIWDEVSHGAHVLWFGMKNFADDSGVIRNNPAWIKSKVFPSRKKLKLAEIIKWLDELVAIGLIISFNYEKNNYYLIDFSQERIDKPTESIVPQQVINVYSIAFANTPAGEERKGKERKGVGEDCAGAHPTHNDLNNFFISKKEKTKWPDEKCSAEAEKFIDHYSRTGWRTKNGPITDWKSAANGWVRSDETFEVHGKTAAKKFPDEWDKNLWQKMSTTEVQEYQMHLISLGFKCRKRPTGEVIDYYKEG